MVPSADVACACAAIDHGAVVASGSSGIISRPSRRLSSQHISRRRRDDRDPRHPPFAGRSSDRGPRRCARPADVFNSPTRGFPPGRSLRSATSASIPDQYDFDMWVVTGRRRELPSLAEIIPLIGWYEREMMDLQGLTFVGHPEPYPLVLRDGGARINGNGFANGRPHLPHVDAGDVQQLPFGPIRADVVESAEFTFLYVGEHIIHYQPRLFFKHRGMETCFEGADPRARRGDSPSVSPRSGLSRMLLPIARRSNARPIANRRYGQRRFGCSSPNSSGYTTTCTTLVTSAIRRRSKWARRRASCSKKPQSSSTHG